jgi:hypothetical protein
MGRYATHVIPSGSEGPRGAGGPASRGPGHSLPLAMTWGAALLLAVTCVSAQAQTDSAVLLDQLAGLLDRGTLNVAVDLKAGSAAISPGWSLETIGQPNAALTVEADDGRVQCLDIDVTGGQLVIAGKGLHPKLEIDHIRFEQGSGITVASFRGRGVWRPIVAVFRTLAQPALRRLDVTTDIGSILRGQILNSKKDSADSSGQFLALVRSVTISKSEFEAFPGYPITLGALMELETTSLRLAIDKAKFTPPARFEVDGRLDGEVQNGAVSFVGSRSTFTRGLLQRGAFRVFSAEKNGKLAMAFSAGALDLDLTNGQFHWPGGPTIGVDAPTRFVVRDLRVAPDGRYSGIVDATLTGKVGSINRAGTTIAANDIQLRTTGTKIVDGKATGDVNLAFQYRLNHTLTVHYPVEELRDRHIPLLLQGLFDTQLHFEDAGSGDEGVVTGRYQFTIPWPPVERAAFEVLRARWEQDLAPAIHKVDFAIEPRRFGPCGRDCFVLDLKLTAAKAKSKGFLFQQICETEGKADLVVDAPTRSLVLRNIRVQPRCEGVLGSLVNFIAPFLTKSYSEIALLQMPADVPFTIDSVGTSADSIMIAGQVDWAMKPAAQTATVGVHTGSR